MIPKDIIEREHILKAMEEIRKTGYIPPNRRAKKYLVEHEGIYYPPKYVISLAYKYASGQELHPEEFHGGKEANTFLKSKGFTIVEFKQINK